MDEFDDIDLVVEEEADDTNISIDYDIASYPSDYTLSGISQMWKDGDIEIPSYQREFVWSKAQSSLLIDSFLCGLPVPPVFLYIDESNKNLVIDGQQRIMSIVFFMDGFFGREDTHGKRQVFRLSGLSKQSPHYNKRFEDLSEEDKRKLKQAVLRAVNIRQLSPIGESTSAYHIFERLNTGGTPLKAQEIRNCVFRGNLSSVLRDANKNSDWRKILGKPLLDKHQKDVELLLRLFALVGSVNSYEKPIKEFLNKAMKKHEKFDTKKSQIFFELFPSLTKSIVDSLGEKPFHLRGPINIAAMESVMCVLAENFKRVDFKNLNQKFSELKLDAEFDENTRINTTDAKSLNRRIEKAKEILLK